MHSVFVLCVLISFLTTFDAFPHGKNGKIKEPIPYNAMSNASREMMARTEVHRNSMQVDVLEHLQPKMSTSGGLRVCYYPNWSQYRPGVGKFTVDNIDPEVCTHLVFAFARIIGTNLAPYEWNDFVMYEKMQQLKLRVPSLRTMLSIGGATMGTAPFAYVSATPERRHEFATNVIAYVRNHGFDGVDIDWEYPQSTEKEMFSELIKTLKLRFLAESESTYRPALELSAAFAAGQYIIDHSYDLPTLGIYLDFANVMSYDLHGGWDPVTGFHSALHGFYFGDPFSQEWVINRYIMRGLPATKILLGVPTYGRSFTLCNQNNHDVRDCALGHGLMGPNTLTPGSLAYYEICQNLASGYTREYDYQQEVPYAYRGNQWVGYDDVQSLLVKRSYVEAQGLGGVVFWDISMDDFRNLCGSGAFPLIKVFSNLSVGTPSTTRSSTSAVVTTTTKIPTPQTSSDPISSTTRSSSQPTETPELTATTTTPTTTTTSTTATTTTAASTSPPTGIQCTEDGEFIRDPNNCAVYYMCHHGIPSRFECPEGTYFDTISNTCNFKDQVDCPHDLKH